MASVYDRADIYDLLENESRGEVYRKHWEKIFEGRKIGTLLDVSIGSGNVTLPLAKLGIRLSGSDLSGTMLDSCRKKAAARGLDVELKRCDFREVADAFTEKFDCVASTGNFRIEDALTLSQVEELMQQGAYQKYVVAPDSVFMEYKAAVVKSASEGALLNGNKLYPHQLDVDSPELLKDGEMLRVYNGNQMFKAVYIFVKKEGVLKPFKMFL